MFLYLSRIKTILFKKKKYFTILYFKNILYFTRKTIFLKK